MVFFKPDKHGNLPKSSDFRIHDPPKGGIVIPKSRCCDAPIEQSGEGIVVSICSKCKKPIGPEPKF